MPQIKFAKQPTVQTTSEMEEKFNFHVAEEIIYIIDVWTGIWADRSQIKAFMA